MRLNGFNMGRLAAMAKGEADYDAETATQAAQNLLMLAKMKNGAMWPANSGNNVAALTDKTRALSEIWSTYPEIANKNAELLSALEEFRFGGGQRPGQHAGRFKNSRSKLWWLPQEIPCRERIVRSRHHRSFFSHI